VQASFNLNGAPPIRAQRSSITSIGRPGASTSTDQSLDDAQYEGFGESGEEGVEGEGRDVRKAPNGLECWQRADLV
jgi:hypothetical protein